MHGHTYMYMYMKLLFGAHYIIPEGLHRARKGLQRTNITAKNKHRD